MQILYCLPHFILQSLSTMLMKFKKNKLSPERPYNCSLADCPGVLHAHRHDKQLTC